MNVTHFLEKAGKLELEPYKRFRDLPKTHVPFTGSIQKHEHESSRLILVSDPFSTNPTYYDFDLGDVEYVEKMPSLVTLSGENLPIFRIWVRKGALALRSFPFVVEDTSVNMPAKP